MSPARLSPAACSGGRGGGCISQRPGQMSAFLPPEWRGHVCAFIRLTPGQKITTGGRAPSGAPKTCPVSKDSGAGPVPVRPSVCVEAAQPYTGSGRPGEKVRENGVSRELGDVPCPQGPERPRPRVWSASEVAQASVASSGCPLWPAEPGGRAVPSAPGGRTSGAVARGGSGAAVGIVRGCAGKTAEPRLVLAKI